MISYWFRYGKTSTWVKVLVSSVLVVIWTAILFNWVFPPLGEILNNNTVG